MTTAALLALCGALLGQTSLPPYFVSISQERSLYARDEQIITIIRLGNAREKTLKVKKYPDLIAHLSVLRDGVELARDQTRDTRVIFDRAPHMEINAHRDFRVRLDRYFPDIHQPGAYEIQYKDDFYDWSLAVKVADVKLPDLESNYVVKTSLGSFTIRLAPRDAPNHARNFAILVATGFYRDMIFHRVVRTRLIQTGDPQNDGSGGSGYPLKLETSPFLKHEAYTVGMARSRERDSATSQWYVCLQPIEELDGEYTTFGQVIDGREVVDEIGHVGTSGPHGEPPDKPFQDVHLESITIVSRGE